ncbi:triosephosphate isomerase [Candidatus Daviesbacteria bacterium]|nr:triosephosphate isomerase [Candidatus Daviesbacteria bacterium]
MAGGDSKNTWIIANWKSNMTIAEALEWVSKVGSEIPKIDNIKVVVCPTFSALSEVKKAIQIGNYPLLVGAQNISPFGVGAYTGEENAQTLSQFIDLAIIGHSERRENFKETDEMITNKVNQVVENKITPLVCVQNSETPIPENCKIVAYEPIFAIGTGNPDTPGNADKIADVLKERYGQNLAVIYGGSVDSGNVKGFVAQENIAGVLVGKASLDADEFIKIIAACDKI